MPIATPEVYAQMFDAAKAGSFAYPAINVSSSQTLNAALQGFTEAGSDGITLIAFGAPIGEQNDGEIVPGWWTS